MGSGLEIHLRRRDGSDIPVDIELNPFLVDGRHLTIAAVRDLTARRAAEEALRERGELLAVLHDRERIGRQINGGIIDALFRTGLRLQGAASVTEDERLAGRIEDAIDELDEVITDLRRYVFGLDQPEETPGDSVSTEMRENLTARS
jgi:signal transduction histidine kinase